MININIRSFESSVGHAYSPQILTPLIPSKFMTFLKFYHRILIYFIIVVVAVVVVGWLLLLLLLLFTQYKKALGVRYKNTWDARRQTYSRWQKINKIRFHKMIVWLLLRTLQSSDSRIPTNNSQVTSHKSITALNHSSFITPSGVQKQPTTTTACIRGKYQTLIEHPMDKYYNGFARLERWLRYIKR